MTAGRLLRRALRVLALCLGALLATICVLVAAASLYLSSARGKDRLLRALVTELNHVLPGRITVRRIQQLGLHSVVLEGVVVTAPAGNEVLAAELVRAEIALQPLLEGRVVLPLAVLENGEGDLRQLTHPRAGLISAVSVPGDGVPSPPARPGAEPDFEIGALSLRDWRVHLPQATPSTPSELALSSLQARISVGNAVEVEVERLDAGIARDGTHLGSVTLRGRWSSQGGSEIDLAGSLCEMDLVLELKVGRLPTGDADWRDVPVELRLQQRGLSAARLGQLALEPQLEPLFLGTAEATLQVRGTARQLHASGELQLEAGRLAFEADARALSQLELRLDTEQLELHRLFSGAPDWRLGTHTRASLELRPGRSAIGLKLSSQLTLNQIALPAIELSSELDQAALRQLELKLEDRWLSLSAGGTLALDGTAQLSGRARVDLAGARSWLRAFALERSLPAQLGAAGGSVNLELAVRRQRSGSLSVQGELDSSALEIDGTRLEQLRTALSFVGVLPRPTLSLDASWAAARHGALALTPGKLHLGGGPQRYGFGLNTGSLSFGSVAASGWLEPGERESRFLVAGSGEFGGAHWRLSMLPARSDGARQLTLPELRVVFADQEARLQGSVSPRACDLTLEFSRVDLQRVLTPLAPQLARAGLLSGKLVARGSPERPELELALSGDGVELLPSTKFDASVSARLDPADDTLELQAGLRDDADAPLPRLDLVWRVRDDHAGKLQTELALSDADGLWLHAQGELGLPRTDARPSLVQLLAAVPAALPGALERESWQLELSAARRPLAHLPLPAGWAGLGELDLDARLLARHAPGSEPRAELDFQLAESTRRAQSATCTVGSFRSKGSLQLRDGRFDAALSAAFNQTPLLSVSGSGALDVFALLRGATRRLPEITLELDARDVPLARLPLLCERVRGQLTASGHVRDPFGRGRAELQVALRDFSLGSDQTVDVAGELSASPDELDWNGTLKAGERRSRFTGQLRRPGSGAAAPMDVVLALDQLPLAPFFPLQGPLSHISGSLSGELRARGARPSPEYSGSLQLHDVSFTVTELAQPLSDINGELSLEHNALVLHQLTARDTNGDLTLDGRFTLKGPRDLEAGLNLKANKFPLRQSGQFIATTSASARIDIGWKPEQQDVRIQLLDMDIWLESNRAPEGLSIEPHPDVVVRQERGTGASLAALAEQESARARREKPNRMSLQIQSRDGFWVRRADFDLKLATDLKIALERPAPTPNSSGVTVAGEIRFERGYLELLGKMFEVQPGGTLRFPGGTSTTLDLIANYQDRRSERTVKVHLRGTATAPKLDFTLDDNPITAGEAFQAIYGSTDNSSDRTEDTEAEASQILSALTAGVITTSIRRRLGAMAPIVAVDPGGSQGVSQVRAGFELDTLIPDFLRDVVTGVYVEGILSSEKLDEQGTQRDVQPGVLIELHFPYNLVTSGRYGPDTTWTVDIGWQP